MGSEMQSLVEEMGAERQQTRAEDEGAGRSNAPHVKQSPSPNPGFARIDEVWLGIRAGAVGPHPCSAKPRSASHRLGCGRLVRPVDSKLQPLR